MNDCKGLFGRIFGHSFQGMYHVEKGEAACESLKCPSKDMVEILEASKSIKQTYLFSQCKRCGVKINELV